MDLPEWVMTDRGVASVSLFFFFLDNLSLLPFAAKMALVRI